MGASTIPNAVLTLNDDGRHDPHLPDNAQYGVRADEGGLTIGELGTKCSQISIYAPSLTPGSVAAATVAAQNFTVTGLAVTDKVFVNGPGPSNSAYMIAARVTAADTLQLIFVNPTAGALTPVAGTYNVVAIRS